jgi:hypothetical protein
MKIISHRGNINGKDLSLENDPKQILKVIELGLDCEVDVWNIDGCYYLGHDFPKHPIKEKFLENSFLWCHAKNFKALNSMNLNKKIHYFWHQNDNFTLTSKNIIWTYPNQQTYENSIIVLNDKQAPPSICFGICTDYPLYYLNR